MNHDFDIQNLFDGWYAYALAHYHYYAGIAIRMLLDWNRFNTWGELFRHALISVILVLMSRRVLDMTGLDEFTVWAVIFCISIVWDRVLRYAMDEALMDIMKAVVAKILKMIK